MRRHATDWTLVLIVFIGAAMIAGLLALTAAASPLAGAALTATALTAAVWLDPRAP